MVTLLTIYILSNVLINRPFKQYCLQVGLAEALFAVILVLFQMYIVNVDKLSNTVWNRLGYAIFTLLMLYTSLLLFIGIKETIRNVRRCYRQYKNEIEGQ